MAIEKLKINYTTQK